MPLEPVSEAFVAELAAAGDPPLHEITPAVARMSDMVGSGMTGRGPEVGSVRNLRVASVDGDFRVRILTPESTPQAIIVYLHGGGWVLGDIDLQYDYVGRDLANRTRSTVVLVNYRKAPEHRFPTAVEDSHAALTWVAENASDLAPSGVPLILAGDSSGGNLAAVLTQRARDAARPNVDLQVLIYPVTDCDLDRPSYHAPENQLLVDRAAMEWFWDHYLPDRSARTSPDASPLRAVDLTGLPPALVYVAEYDPLYDEGVAYAQALAAAGVPVDVETAIGELHGFFQMANILPGYEDGIRLVSDYINAFVAASRKVA